MNRRTFLGAAGMVPLAQSTPKRRTTVSIREDSFFINGKPNEDDHFHFNEPDNHMMAALPAYVSWGYFDPGRSDYSDGYQCPPVNWGINTDRKKQFFRTLKEITGS